MLVGGRFCSKTVKFTFGTQSDFLQMILEDYNQCRLLEDHADEPSRLSDLMTIATILDREES